MKKVQKLRKLINSIILLCTFGGICMFLQPAILVKADFVSGQCGELAYYTMSSDGKVLTISGTGEMYDYEDVRETPLYAELHNTESYYVNRHYYTGNLEKIVIEDGITHIGEGFFFFLNSENPIEVSFGSTLISIGKNAFASSNIAINNFPEGLLEIDDYAFNGCRLDNIVTFPASLRRIGKYAFEMNNRLQGVRFTGTNTEIDDYAFASCSSFSDEIKAIYDLKGVKIIGKHALDGVIFAESFTNTNDITNVGEYAFYHCQDISQIDLSGVKEIAAHALEGCHSLEGVTFSSALEWVDDYAFYQCHKLKTVSLPETLRYVGEEAFAFNEELVSVNISENATATFGKGAFSNNWNLTNISLPNGMSNIPAGFLAGSGITSISIPRGVKTIGDRAFALSNNLVSIDLPEGLESIGSGAFEQCMYLENIVLPSSLTSIGECSFRYCTNVKISNLPKNITSIGSDAFNSCEAITSIDFPEGVDEIPERCFVGCKNLTSITLHDGLRAIRTQALGDCPKLTTITLPSTVMQIDNKAFLSDIGLTSINIPEGVTEISESAFESCMALEKIVLPTTIKKLGKRAFYDCLALGTINIPEGVTSIGEYAFAVDEYKINKGVPVASIVLPSTLKSIGAYAFYQCHNLTELVIPEGCISIGDFAFYGIVGMKIYGKTGSAAESFAEKYGISFVSNGTVSQQVAVYKEGSCGNNVSWTLYYNGTLKISGTGEMSDYDVVNGVYTNIMTPWYEDRSRIEGVIIESGITKIGCCAFEECDNLSSVILANSIKEIGDYAFFRCGNLTEIELPASIRFFGQNIFMYCSKLHEVILPEGITTIGQGMFSSCTALKSISLPATINTINEQAFAHCDSLTSVEIPAGVTRLETDTFRKCIDLTNVVLPEGILSIGYGCFTGCEKLKEINIPNSVETIGQEAFWGCEKLSVINFPNNLRELGDRALAGTGITQLTLPENIAVLGNYVFTDCAELETIALERTTAFEYALNHTFENCIKLKNVKFAGNCFGEELMQDMFSGCTALEKISIPEGVKVIGNRAFWGCEGLKYVTLPSTLNMIADEAFDGCTSLTEINIPNSLENIDGIVGCSKLTTLVLSPNVGCTTFRDCSALTRLVMPGNDYKYGSSSAWFDIRGCEKLKLYAFDDSGVKEFAEDNEITYYSIIASGECGKSCVAYLAEDGTLFVGGSGEFIGLPSNFINKDEVETVYIASGITKICSKALANLTNVKEIELPVSINAIEDDAFDGCNSAACIISEEGSYSYEWATKHDIGKTEKNDEFLQADDIEASVGAKLAGYTLALDENIGVNFYMDIDDALVNDPGAKVVFDLPDNSKQEIYVKDGKRVVVGEKTYSVFGCFVAAAQMTDTISVKVVLSDGREGTPYQYSVLEYAKYILEHPVEYKGVYDIVIAMLNYGANAQLYFGYNTEQLANDMLSDDQKALAYADVPDLSKYQLEVKGGDSSFSYMGYSLVLESATRMKFYFLDETNISEEEVKVKLDGKVLDASRVKVGEIDGGHYICVYKITPSDYGAEITLNVKDITIEHASVYSYIGKALEEKWDNPNFVNLLKAMYWYGENVRN